MVTDAGRRVQLFYNVATGGCCPTKLSRLRSSLEASGAEVRGPGKEVVISEPIGLLRGKDVAGLPEASVFTSTGFTAGGSTPLPVQTDGDIVAALPIEVRARADPTRLC